MDNLVNLVRLMLLYEDEGNHHGMKVILLEAEAVAPKDSIVSASQ